MKKITLTLVGLMMIFSSAFAVKNTSQITYPGKFGEHSGTKAGIHWKSDASGITFTCQGKYYIPTALANNPPAQGHALILTNTEAVKNPKYILVTGDSAIDPSIDEFPSNVEIPIANTTKGSAQVLCVPEAYINSFEIADNYVKN